MVYDASRSGLNRALWVPSFPLPTADSLTDLLDEASWMADIDMGEMFLNFPLDVNIRQFCGVDLKPYFLKEAGAKTLWERWERCVMGLRPSPYVTTKCVALADEMVFGDRRNPTNPFHWEQVQLNLPGDPSYSPTAPWVSRRTKDGALAGGLVKYIDDIRPVARGTEACWNLAHTIACRYTYLGLQIATRKFRAPSQSPGAWAGVIAAVSPLGISLQCSQEKWDKAKQYLEEIQAELATEQRLPYKPLEQKPGFFIHMMRTYPCITPFLKGMHMTLDGWRGGRTPDGWKGGDSEPDWDDYIEGNSGAGAHPDSVLAVPRLASDVTSLLHLMRSEQPPLRLVRSSRLAVAIYGFGDASGSGFGSSFATPDGDLHFCHGIWGPDAEGQSSNYRELRNLVESIEEGMQSGLLRGSEVFIFTDNTTAEGAYYKGNSDSPVLFDLVLRLRTVDMEGLIKLHVIHVAGTRMIAQGTDGLSRGDYSSGVMAGAPVLGFVPLHLSAFDRSPLLLPWVREWALDPNIIPLTPEEWYDRGQGLAGGVLVESVWQPRPLPSSCFLWAPPPAAAGHAVDQLMLARHKRTHHTHIFLCPRLFTSLWRHKLHKVADLVLELPAGPQPFWPSVMHEPLIIGLTLRFVSFDPWELRNHPSLLDLGREVRRLWDLPVQHVGAVLRQLFQLPELLESVSSGLVRDLLHAPPSGQVLSLCAD